MRVSVPVTIRNVAATILDLVGEPASLPGHSYRRLWITPDSAVQAAPDTILSEVGYTPGLPANYPVSHGPIVSIVADGLRYIRSGTGVELYDFERDAEEQADLARTPAGQASLARLGNMLDTIRGSGRVSRKQ
jgi:hypothetical protein